MSKVDIDKLVVTLVEEMNSRTMLGEDVRYCLERQGLKVENGEIVGIMEENLGIDKRIQELHDATLRKIEEDLKPKKITFKNGYYQISDQEKIVNAIDVITGIDMNSMVIEYRKNISGDGLPCRIHDLRTESYKHGIIDTIKEIREIINRL